VEYIAERAEGAVFRGYWAPSKEERDRREAPDVAQALMTGLERVCLRAYNSLTQAPRYEARILRRFRRRIHHYLPGVSLPENSLELIALMQHHGAPTRLLDWTYSPYVAAHFALIHASRRPAGADLAIWTIRPNWCRDASKAACKGMKPPPVALWKQIDNPGDDQRAGSSLLSGKLPPSVWPVNPFRLNERLTIQQGLFLAPGDVRESFIRNIAKLPSFGESNLTRYVIPHSRSHAVAQSLYRMNVTETTLFPGLDGFARSLGFLHEGPERDGDATR